LSEQRARRALGVAKRGWAVLLLVSLAACDRQPSAPFDGRPATYVGRQSCIPCHERENELWSGSHHDLAMQVADETTVLGDFDNAVFSHEGVTSTFSRQDGKFVVRTEGPQGEPADYEVAYTFGVEPLQQYLVAFPGGRYQVLSLCWDSRPVEQGGQRWFHLYPDEPVPPGDELHWTSANQNWNYMCADCHSTDLRKNYDLASDTFRTEWEEIDVSCEACHGPASNHVTWAETDPRQRDEAGAMGLAARLTGDRGMWLMDAASGIASRSPQLRSRAELDTCARCHSRRSVLFEGFRPGRPLADAHAVALLEERLYHADGQIDDEVYVYGSFLQSKMYRAGVTCSDCHDPHSLQVRGVGNGVCAGCHAGSKFDTTSHHFHRVDSTGASCVACHMPVKSYMVVDPRHDHGFRIPRPALSASIGAPDTCTGCHVDRTQEWAAAAMADWYGSTEDESPHYAQALFAGRRNLAHAGTALERVAQDTEEPPIVRATALSMLGRHGRNETQPIVRQALGDPDPLVRIGALRLLEAVPPTQRLPLAYPLLFDPVGAVRVRAARVLAPVPGDELTAEQQAAIAEGLAEYRLTQLTNAERPESHLNIGMMHFERGELAAAEAAFRTALRIAPGFVPAHVNLADLYRAKSDDEAGERELRAALKIQPDNAEAHHALGLLLVRRKRTDDAIRELERAALLSPDQPRYGYVLGVALCELGELERGLEILEGVHRRHPADREVLIALTTLEQQHGMIDDALRHARKLLELTPTDPVATGWAQKG